MTHMIWLHEDCLRDNSPARAAAGEDAVAVHIWDDTYLREQNYSFKRLAFLYETLCETRAYIYEGDTVETLALLMRERNVTRLYIPFTPNPALQRIINILRETVDGTAEVHVIDDTPFVRLRKPITAKRFFAYWKKTESYALTQNGIGKTSL